MNDTSPRRIALVITELRPGGAERNLAALAIGLAQRQFSPHVYSLAPPPDDSEDLLVDELQSARIPVSFVSVRRKWQFFTGVRRLREMLRRQSPDLIQSFLFHANVVSAVAARGLNAPTVAGLRVAQRELLRRLVERRLADRFSAFVCVSQSVADIAVNDARFPTDKVHVIHNGLAPERFVDVAPADLTTLGVEPKRRVILGMGRMERQKGFDLLIDAAREFLPRVKNAVLLIVGDGTELSALRKQSARHALKERIVFAPWQPDPLSIIAAADVVAVPSRYEGMSNVLLEAAALGRPIVASDVEGIRETLSPAGHSMIVPRGNATVLAEKIIQSLQETSAAVAIADSNRQYIYSQFPIDRMISRYADLYASLTSPTLPS